MADDAYKSPTAAGKEPHAGTRGRIYGSILETIGDTPLVHLAKLPLEYLQLGEGFESSECIPLVCAIPSLTRITFTNAKALSDADLKQLSGMPKLESLEMSGVELTDERVELLKAFSKLKALRIVSRPKPYSPEVQAKIKTLLPKTELKFE